MLMEIFGGNQQSYVPWSAPRWSSAKGFSHRLHSCQIARTRVVEKIQPSPVHVARQITPLRHVELTSNIFLTPKCICVPWNSLRRLSTYTEPSNSLELVRSRSAAASKHSNALPRPHAEPSRCMLTGLFPTFRCDY
jgi:hypothetical protein